MADVLRSSSAAPSAPAPDGRQVTAPAPAVSPLPGLAVAATGALIALAANLLLPTVSALMIALLLGAAAANTGMLRPATAPGLRIAAKTPMRAGIVLLGLQLALPDVLALGAPVLAVVLVTVVATFVGTAFAARLVGLALRRGLLVAAGVSICGASAVAAMNGTVDGEEDDVMTAVALVTLFGTAAMLVLPLVGGALGLSDRAFGTWAGAGVHEVGQVVAVAGSAGAAALAPAVVVKLTRVALLAPMIVGVSLWLRRTRPADGGAKRPPIVPLFVVGFLAAVGIGSLGVLPPSLLHAAGVVQNVLLCVGLFALGASVRLLPLVRTSGRSLLLGAIGTVLVCGISGAGVALVL